MYLYIIILVLLALPAFGKRNYKKKFLAPFSKGLIGVLYPMGLWLYECFSKKFLKNRRTELEQTEAVYRMDKPLERMKIEGAKKFAMIWCCLFFGTFLSMAITAANRTPKLNNNQLERPEFGETDSYELSIEGETIQEDLSVTVHGKQPNETEMTEKFDQIFEKVKRDILGENTSLDEVRSDLSLMSSSDYGIRVDWESKNPESINNLGRILEENIPNEGMQVSFAVRLTYASYEADYELAVKLVPPVKNEAFYLSILKNQIEKSDKDGIESNYLVLPENLDGKPLSYQMKQDKTGAYFLILTVLGAVCIYFAGKRQLYGKYEARRKQLIQDYPTLVSKLNLLIGSGLTLRAAWNRIIEDYKISQKKGNQKKRYAYEEMILTANSIKAGYPEGSAYGEFGRRCKVHSYLKLGNLLEQNLRQGIAGINKKLEEEMVTALEEKKSNALRLGEEAGTKLLLPMFLMLGIVIVVLIVPAFASFQF